MRSLFILMLALTSVAALAAEADKGILPTDANGAPLNFDFETGTLKDWTASGDAFTGQPIKGDTIFARRKDMHSHHAGQFWIGSYEPSGADAARGTLTSVPFKVTQPYASFLIGGGSNLSEERVEIVSASDQRIVYRATGQESEEMRRVAVDLRKEVGNKVFIRVVDDSSGLWGHINFDDFKFLVNDPALPKEPSAELLQQDIVKNAGLAPEESAKAITLPPGFKATLFAGEPDIVQPVAFTIDDRGRLWVAEALNYPAKAKPGQGKDKIIIFEDTKGDGHFDKRTVFMEGLNLVSGLEVGFGGVWVGQAPELLYIPILEGDKPGKPEVLLDGWGYGDSHETLNTFSWGPDGWLYGCQGVFVQSKIGKPGTPINERTPLNCCVWRLHPTKKTFEIFAEGGSNQWGVDWNDNGQMFMTACVIPHLYHVIQGARYFRQGGEHFEKYTFADIKTIADHLHWATGAANQWAANNRSGAFGGGHAHAGAMIYLGDNWPKEYRNQIFMSNIHGNRVNEDLLEHDAGSGYVGHHGSDFLMMNDKWSRLMNLKYGPDGGVYLIDWYDQQACHLNQPEKFDRSNGRIYKITYGDVTPIKTDLSRWTDEQLLNVQQQRNDWFVRHARRILQERAAANPKSVREHEIQVSKGIKATTPAQKLRWLWCSHAISGTNEQSAAKTLGDKNEFVRAWTIQLLAENRQVSAGLLKRFEQMASEDSSPVVRLYLASAIGRLPLEQRWGTLTALVAHSDDAADHNLPYLYWYAIEPCVPTDVNRAAKIAIDTKIPMLREFIARRLAVISDEPALTAAISILSAGDDAAKNQALKGILDAFTGKRSVKPPEAWTAAYEALKQSTEPDVKQKTQALATIFGDRKALAALRTTLADSSADLAQRQNALDSLLAARDVETLPILQKLVADPKLRGGAIRGLAAFEDPKTPTIIIAAYPALDGPSKLAALNTLASRVSFAEAMIAAIKENRIPKSDLTAPTVRNLQGLDDAAITQWITTSWGAVRASAGDKVAEIKRYKTLLKPEAIAKADAANGRAIFVKTCMQCHTLFDVGAKIGPDLTGSNRVNVDYLLENIVDPSAVIGKDYLMTTVKTKDGRQLDGIIKTESAESITLATVNEIISLPKNEIASQKTSQLSMMPEGLLAGLSGREVCDLVKYLGSPAQVPLSVTPESAAVFFNCKDLTGWDGDPKLWHVEDGQIVGKTTTGLKRNNFIFNQLELADFRLVLQVKLVPNAGNSGVQFRSVPWEGGEAKGYQADIGAGWWGKIYEESGRGLLTKEGDEKYLKPEEWNTYEVLAVGDHIRVALNGHVCSDITDPAGNKHGQTALQLHAGGPTEVRFKDIQLEINPKDEMKTASN